MLGKPSRVDRQVAVLVVSLLFLSGLAVYFYAGIINKSIQHDLMYERANAVFQVLQLEDLSDLSSIGSEGNIDSAPAGSQAKLQESVERLRIISNADHIYLSWRGDDSNWISLFSSHSIQSEAKDTFNKSWIPDENAQAFIKEAFRSGNVMLTPGVITTDYDRLWGFYYPLSNAQGDRLAVLAVEFSSHMISSGNLRIFIGTIIIILLASAAAIGLAVWRFHTISILSHKTSYNVDGMTGFKSRNTFDLDLANINSTRTYESLTVFYIDLNDLKRVNDTQGHGAGDDYLKIMANLIRNSFDDKDVIYRVGGDEFCVLSFSHIRNLAREKMKLFLKNTEDYSQKNNKNYSAAIGFAIFNYDMDVDASTTRIRAEMSMYENKKRMKNGSNLVMDDNLVVARQIARQWEHAAIDNYRPDVNCDTDSAVHAESNGKPDPDIQTDNSDK